MSLFEALFLPLGYPFSVAADYGPYQLFDTLQQCAFFVNTVISAQAIMKLHGVGDATVSPATATALQFSRDLLARLFLLLVATPSAISLYKRRAAPIRMLSGVLDAAGHLLEVLASIIASAVLPYAGPVVCTIGGTLGGAVRAVILQHFAEGGTAASWRPDYGDLALKESNQDKGGKLVGLALGLMLLRMIGAQAGRPASEADSLALVCFAALSVVHVAGNAAAVQQLRLQPAAAPATPAAAPSSSWRRMFLPPGYPDSVSPEYRAYRLCAVARTLLGRPTALVSSLFTWSWVYGVGDASRTPEQAVRIDIFLQAVAAVTALAAGFPLFTRAFDYTQPRWKLLSALLAAAAGVLRFGASFVAHRPILFFSTAAAAQAVAAFAGTAGAKVNGLIAPAFIKNRAAVQLVDIKVADTNQAAAVDVVATLLCLAVLRRLAAAPPETSALLAAYAALQALDVAAAVGLYHYMPPLGAAREDESASRASLVVEPEPEGAAASPGRRPRTPRRSRSSAV